MGTSSREPERRRQSGGMRGLRIAVLTADTLPLLGMGLAVVVLPRSGGGEGQFWAGLLLAYALLAVFGLALALNLVYVIALAVMRGRYDNHYGLLSRALLFLLPGAAVLGLMIH